MSEDTSPLDGKRVLIVDDEPDILESLEDLLPMCEIQTAESFEEARELLDAVIFDVAILDIMGVEGYELLKIAARRKMTAVMLTAYALTPDDVAKSYNEGAAYYVPKEEMASIALFLSEVLAAKAKGENTWSGWVDRMSSFCQRKFKPDWQSDDRIYWEKFPFH